MGTVGWCVWVGGRVCACVNGVECGGMHVGGVVWWGGVCAAAVMYVPQRWCVLLGAEVCVMGVLYSVKDSVGVYMCVLVCCMYRCAGE